MATKHSLLTEAELHVLNRNLNSLMPKSDDNLNWHHEKSPEALLECLLYTVAEPSIGLKHRACACDALRGFLEHGANSTHSIRELCISRKTWRATLEVYLVRSDDAAKPMRQLLMTLVRILTKLSNDEITQDALVKCLESIYNTDDLSAVKPAMLTLELLLRKRLISSYQLIKSASDTVGLCRSFARAGNAAKPSSLDVIVPCITEFAAVILSWVHYAHIAPAASKLLVAFFESLDEEAVVSQDDLLVPLWVEPVQTLMNEDEETTGILERQILPNLLQTGNNNSVKSSRDCRLLGRLGVDLILSNDIGNIPEKNIRLCLLILGYMGSGAIDNEATLCSNCTLVPRSCLHLMAHSSLDIRLRAFSLAVSSPKYSLTIISPENIHLLLDHLLSFYMDTDARARNEFLNSMKRLFFYLASSMEKATRPLKQDHNFDVRTQPVLTTESSTFVNYYGIQDFVAQYLEFIYRELRPSTSYQRHYTALRTLKTAITTGLVNLTKTDVNTALVMRTLVDLTMNCFDDVRASAADLLKEFPVAILMQSFYTESSPCSTGSKILGSADKLVRLTGRADHADGTGRLYNLAFGLSIHTRMMQGCGESPFDLLFNLLSHLEVDIQVASVNIHRATTSAPIHGRFIAMRYILRRQDVSKALPSEQHWRSFQDRLAWCFFEVWETVKLILCVDSPEGQEDHNGDSDADGGKDTLSYCWRTLKEASALMQATVKNPHYGLYGVRRKLTHQDYKTLGELSFMQLAELRHKGAFSTVSQTFASWCIECVKSQIPETMLLPQTWYQEALKCIQEKASALTRRSAGLPAMICGVLLPYSDNQFFDIVMTELIDTARIKATQTKRPSQRLPQVHALNCIKEIFTTSGLVFGTEKYLTSVIQVALDCLESRVWAIRNCGIMLFNALLTRLTGGSGSNIVGTGPKHRRFPKAIYRKYPGLTEILVTQLKKCSDLQFTGVRGFSSLQMQVAFPAMEILNRVGVPESCNSTVEDHLFGLLQSPVWNIREKAARTLSPLISKNTIVQKITLEITNAAVTANFLHGALMCLNYAFREKQPLLGVDVSKLIDSILEFYRALVGKGRNPIVAGEYFKVLSSLLVALASLEERVPPQDLLTGLHTQDLRTTKEPQLQRFLRLVMLQLRETERSLPTISKHCFWSNYLLYLKAQCVSHQSWSEHDTTGSRAQYRDWISSGDPSILRVVLQAFSQYPPRCGIEQVFDMLKALPSILISTQKGVAANALNHLTYGLTSLMELSSHEALQFKHGILCSQMTLLLDTGLLGIVNEPSAEPPAIVLEGTIVRYLCHFAGQDWPKARHMGRWTINLKAALDDKSELPKRLSAIRSIQCFGEALREPSQARPHAVDEYLSVFCTLYDGLMDDDDDVRDSAASTVSWVLSRPSCIEALNPTVAAQRLLQFLSEQYKESKYLCLEALGRVVASSSSAEFINAKATEKQLVIRDQANFQLRFQMAIKDDSSLFVEEKRNLYVDEAQDTERWASILCGATKQIRSLRLLDTVVDLAEGGICAMLDLFQGRPDGPLGQSSNAEVFTLGIRALALAEVSLYCLREEVEIRQRLKLKELLKRLHVTGIASCVNEHWLAKIEELIRKK